MEWVNQMCPRCEQIKSGYPAISRVDNTTEICSECGQAEAMEALRKAQERYTEPLMRYCVHCGQYHDAEALESGWKCPMERDPE